MTEKLFLRLLLIVFFTGARSAAGQGMLGVVNSNYAGIDGIMINPASLANSRYWLDINLVSADFFVQNNYEYLPTQDYKFTRYFYPRELDKTYNSNYLSVEHTKNNQLKSGYSDFRLMGPSFSITAKNHVFGLFTTVREAFSVNQVSKDLADFMYYKLKNSDQYNISYRNEKVRGAALAWAEFGISYAYTFADDGNTKQTLGVSAKLLKGYAGAYMNTGSFDYRVNNYNSIDITKINLRAGYSLPINYATNDYVSSPTFRGSGFGFDLGYAILKKAGQSATWNKVEQVCQSFNNNRIKYNHKYLYRLGISLQDFGKVNFTNNAQAVEYVASSMINLDYWSLNRSSVGLVVADLSNRLYGSPATAIKSGRISVGLPTALSVQYDRSILPDLYLNVTLTVPARIFKNSVQRPFLIAITPRYERDFFEISMPLSLYNFTQPHIGLCARFGIIYIGTDNLNCIFGLANVQGLSIYAGLKVGFLKRNYADTR